LAASQEGPFLMPEIPDPKQELLQRLKGDSAPAVAPPGPDDPKATLPAATNLIPGNRASAPPVQLQWTRLAAMAFVLAGMVLFLAWPRSPVPESSQGPTDGSHQEKQPPVSSSTPSLDRLTPRPRPPALAAQPLKVGATVRTGPRERRRLGLPDGSMLYVNQNTTVKLDRPRILTLSAGEVFLELSPSAKKPGDAPFQVKTAQRTISARGTKFAVRAEAGVIVAQGSVQVSGLANPLRSGQQLLPETGKPAPAPRTSHVLDWTRELMAAAESPLVPASKFAGGALVVIDPKGDEAFLSLRKYHIDVHIEDGFARTTIDHTYFNHSDSRLEGTFYFPVPPDASLSRLAMYVDGNLMEGGMAERYYAREVFERIVATQKDPALLEWVDGSTFKMRVFPLEPRQEKRIILSYTQKLPDLYGQAQYRFPAGHSLETVGAWSFHARVKNGGAWEWRSRSHALKASKDGPDLLLDAAQKNVKPDRDVVVDLHDPRQSGPVQEAVRCSSSEQDGARYLMLRYRPVLPAREERPRRDWVFLFESSGERDPLLARTQVEIIRSVLANAEHGDTFAILTAGIRARALADKLQPATPQNVQAALAMLDQTHLIGAFDLGKALEAAAPFLKAAKNPWLVHLGSGKAGMGERRAEVLAKRIPAGSHYVGVGVGKRWSRQFMKLAAERTDGYITQINPDEPITWRAFDLVATLNTPRLLNVRAVDPDKQAVFLTYANSLAQGEELCAIARLEKPAGELDPTVPKSVLVTGEVNGKRFRQTVAIKKTAPHADYLPRTWAKLEIDRLLAENAEKNKDRIIELSKAMYVMTPYTSLLVLENEKMYKDFKVDRGRKDHWAMYPCPRRIPVVKEPGPKVREEDRSNTSRVPRPSAEEVLETILIRIPPRLLMRKPPPENIAPLWYTLAGNVIFRMADDPPRFYLRGNSQTALQLFGKVEAAPELEPQGSVTGLILPSDISEPLPAAKWADDEGIGLSALKLIGGSAPFFAPGSWNPRGGFGGLTGIGGLGSGVAGLGGGLAGLGGIGGIGGFGKAGGIERIGRFGGGFAKNGGIEGISRFGGFRPGGGIPVFEEMDQRDDPSAIQQQVQESLRHKDPGLLRRARAVREKLAEHISIPGFEAHTPLKDALEYLSNRYDLTFVINTQAFKEEAEGADIEQTPIALQKMSNVALGTVLRLLISQTPPSGGVIVVRHDYLELTTRKRMTEENAFEAYPTGEAGEILGRGGQFGIGKGFIVFEAGAADYLDRPFTSWKALRRVTLRVPRDSSPFLTLPTLAKSGGTPGDLWHSLSRPGSTGWIEPDQWSLAEPAGDAPEEEWIAALLGNAPGDERPPLYHRPTFHFDDRIFTDLTLHAPGLNTTRSDIRGVLEAEAAPDPGRAPGRIDPGARRLIERARSAGWHTITLPPSGLQQTDLGPASTFSLTFDGKGRFCYDRILPIGLREQVVCDGTTLWHLYPELGIAARRTLNRFHRAEFARLVPWALPLADDLARGADVQCLDSRTVAITPLSRTSVRGPDGKPLPPTQMHLVFAGDGRLAERQLVDISSKKVRYREKYGAGVQLLDPAGIKLVDSRLTVRPATKPNLKADTKKLVVLRLPLRTAGHIYQAYQIDREKTPFCNLNDEVAQSLLAAFFGEPSLSNRELRDLFWQRYWARGIRHLGFYTLLAADGFNVAPRLDLTKFFALEMQMGGLITLSPSGISRALDYVDFNKDDTFPNVLIEHPREPLARYLAMACNPRLLPFSLGGNGRRWQGFMERLHDLHVRYQRKGKPASLAEIDSALRKIRQGGRDAFGWAALSLLQDQAGGNPAAQRDIAAAYRLFDKVPGLNYEARYEYAHSLLLRGRRKKARQLFLDLYTRTLKQGLLPPIDRRFRQALLGNRAEPDHWSEFARRTVGRLVTNKHHQAAILVAWQCWQLGDHALATDLLARAQANLPKGTERLRADLLAIDFLWQTGQLRQADKVMESLLADKDLARRSDLWRLAAALAKQRKQEARSCQCLEKAVDIDFRHLPEVIDLAAVRHDFGLLLGQYQQTTEALAKLDKSPPRQLAIKVIRATERWRTLDPDNPTICPVAGQILYKLRAKEPAWEYLNTPQAFLPPDADSWLEFAQALGGQEDFAMADLAYEQACQAEPENARLLWERAKNLERAGKKKEARKVYLLLAGGKWEDQYQWIQDEARRQLKGR
jgi:hypothetical protein